MPEREATSTGTMGEPDAAGVDPPTIETADESVAATPRPDAPETDGAATVDAPTAPAAPSEVAAPPAADAPTVEQEFEQPAASAGSGPAPTDDQTVPDRDNADDADDAAVSTEDDRPADDHRATEDDIERTVVLAPGGPGNSWFEPWADDSTQALPRTTGDPVAPDSEDTQVQRPISQAMASVDPNTEQLPVTPRDSTPPGGFPADTDTDDGGSGRASRPKGRVAALVVGGLALLALLGYGADVLLSQGTVPRGTVVAGIAVGGLTPAAAEQRLRAEIEPRTTEPVQVSLGEATSTIDPVTTGLAVDWDATVAAVGDQPLNPITRIASLFGSREVDVVTTADDAALTSALSELAPTITRAPAEGTVRFEGTTPIAVQPEPGREMDLQAAAATVRREWVLGRTVDLPITTVPALTTAEGVATAVETVARPAVASPFTLTGEGGTSAELTPQQITQVLAFTPGVGGGLVGEVDPTALEQVVGDAFTSSERPGRDASLSFTTGAPVIVPHQDGRGVDYAATAVAMGPPLIGAQPREAAAVYAEDPAELTTEKLSELGITGLVSEFTTRGFAADSGRNIRRAAEQINGTIVEPGETFSLNAATNPRDSSNGYVEAGIIEDGHPSRGVGGGVSQVATTLYNAAYFGGMQLVEHKEHSFYIGRYPAGREATVFENLIDLKFRNNGPTAVMIQTEWTPSAITVRLYGTKYYEVTSATGPRTAPTDPKTVTIPAGEPCSPSQGAPGFTVTDTRTLRDLDTGAVRSDPTRTVRYNPSPIVECDG